LQALRNQNHIPLAINEAIEEGKASNKKIPLIILTNGNTLKQLLAKAAISYKNKSKWSKTKIQCY
jgi:6-phosphogluconolactonase/glucosamine-6-phosphate isomerase/deaminase